MCPHKYALKPSKMKPFHFKVWMDIAQLKRRNEMAVFMYFNGVWAEESLMKEQSQFEQNTVWKYFWGKAAWVTQLYQLFRSFDTLVKDDPPHG